MLCSYGCGREAIKQFANGKWCCGEKWSSCSAMRKTKENSEGRRRAAEKHSEWMKNGGSAYIASFITEEDRRRQSEWMKEWGAAYITSFVTEEGRRRISEKKTGRTKENDEGRKITSEKKKGKTKENDESVRRQAEKLTGRTKETHEGVRITAEKLTGRNKKNDEGRKITSEKIKALWKDPEYQQKQCEASHTFPNKPETLILSILNELYPNEWKYTGDYSFWINGKNPDFTCINGKKLLIEHFGTYWHKDDDPEEQKEIYSEFGYKTLIIWENELKNIEEVESKIKLFVEERNS